MMTRLLILLSFLVCTVFPSFAQHRSGSSQWTALHRQLEKGEVSRADYLDSIRILANIEIAQGVYYSNAEYLDLLKHFRQIVWNKGNMYRQKRETYYLLLANNAKMQLLQGVAFYYAEKADAEARPNGKTTFYALNQRCDFYTSQGKYRNVINEFNKDTLLKNELELPGKHARLAVIDAVNVMLLLNTVIYAYSNLGDSANTIKYIHIGESIMNNISSADLDKHEGFNRLLTDFFRAGNQYTYYFNALKNYRLAGRYLDSIAVLISTPRYQVHDGYLNIIRSNYSWMKANYFLTLEQADSSAFYLELYKSNSELANDQISDITLMEAKLLAGNDRYKDAYQLIERASEAQKDEFNQLTDELDDLLYAHTESEHNKALLLETEKEKQQRTIWILVITTTALILLLLGYFLFQRTKRKLQYTIENLNNTANFQIAALEEEKQQAVKEEKEKMAQELHDDFSATLASTKYQIEVLINESENAAQKNKLYGLKAQIEKVYDTSRNKSHQWYYDARAQKQVSFTKAIATLADSALPDYKYKKDVQIDPDAVESLSLNMRIELLRVIQEAFTNIIKHSKATEVNVLLFRNNGTVKLQIADNGVGISGSKFGMGLNSISKRVNDLGGSVKIINDEGILIDIAIPEKQ